MLVECQFIRWLVNCHHGRKLSWILSTCSAGCKAWRLLWVSILSAVSKLFLNGLNNLINSWLWGMLVCNYNTLVIHWKNLIKLVFINSFFYTLIILLIVREDILMFIWEHITAEEANSTLNVFGYIFVGNTLQFIVIGKFDLFLLVIICELATSEIIYLNANSTAVGVLSLCVYTKQECLVFLSKFLNFIK